jgi:hypothetical protein
LRFIESNNSLSSFLGKFNSHALLVWLVLLVLIILLLLISELVELALFSSLLELFWLGFPFIFLAVWLELIPFDYYLLEWFFKEFSLRILGELIFLLEIIFFSLLNLFIRGVFNWLSFSANSTETNPFFLMVSSMISDSLFFLYFFSCSFLLLLSSWFCISREMDFLWFKWFSV